MNIGQYTFEEFKKKTEEFHSYAAPGVLVGAYMVELAKKSLPQGTLFEALVETKKCLPDAVQMLTLCSAGNNWMKIVDHGKYALALYDKHTGHGFRVSLSLKKMTAYDEILAWFMRTKPKKEQDVERLWRQIEKAGDSLCDSIPICIEKRFLGHTPSYPHMVCSKCGEACPENNQGKCLACAGEALYSLRL